MNPQIQKKLPDIIAIAALLCYIVIGLSIVGDFGVNWDDDTQHLIGIRNVEYLVFQDKEPIRQSIDRYHGPAFEIGLYILERLLHIKDLHSIYLMRHTVVFLYMIICIFVFYLLVRKLFSNKWMPLLGSLIFILHPRIFADSFYNPKDITVMGGMMIGLYTLIMFSESLSWGYLIVHAFICAFCIDIRVNCTMLSMATVGILLYKNILIEKHPASEIVLKLTSYLTLTFIFILPMWPILMDGPFHELGAAIDQLSDYPALFRGLNLFNGKFYKGVATPGQYQFVWFFMTTPIIYSLFFFVGVFLLFVALFKRKASFNSNIYVWLSLGFYVIPPAAMWYFHSVLSNGWRHIFMIYPFFVLVCLFAINSLIEKGALIRKVTMITLSASIVFNIGMLCYLHPFEYTYFNPLTVQCLTPLDKKFEIDYYGVSFKQGFEYLLKNQYKGKPIKVLVSNHPGYENFSFLPEADKAKIIMTEAKDSDAEYYLDMHRWDKDTTLMRHCLYEYKRQGNKVMSIYKLQ